jgi:hypothetical protein
VLFLSPLSRQTGAREKQHNRVGQVVGDALAFVVHVAEQLFDTPLTRTLPKVLPCALILPAVIMIEDREIVIGNKGAD